MLLTPECALHQLPNVQEEPHGQKIISSSEATATDREREVSLEFCKICAYRNVVLPETDRSSPHETLHTPRHLIDQGITRRAEVNRKIMRAMHEEPPVLWRRVLDQHKLHGGDVADVDSRGRFWMKFLRRNMRALQQLPSAHLQTETPYLMD